MSIGGEWRVDTARVDFKLVHGSGTAEALGAGARGPVLLVIHPAASRIYMTDIRRRCSTSTSAATVCPSSTPPDTRHPVQSQLCQTSGIKEQPRTASSCAFSSVLAILRSPPVASGRHITSQCDEEGVDYCQFFGCTNVHAYLLGVKLWIRVLSVRMRLRL